MKNTILIELCPEKQDIIVKWLIKKIKTEIKNGRKEYVRKLDSILDNYLYVSKNKVDTFYFISRNLLKNFNVTFRNLKILDISQNVPPKMVQDCFIVKVRCSNDSVCYLTESSVVKFLDELKIEELEHL